jgi:hypothetical protein
MRSIPQTPINFLRKRICAASILLLSCILKTRQTSILQRPVLLLLYVILPQFNLSLLGKEYTLIKDEFQNNFITCMKSLKSLSLAYRVVQLCNDYCAESKSRHYSSASHEKSGPGTSVGTATDYGLDGPGIECPLVPKIAGSNPAETVGFFRLGKFTACLPSEREVK